MKPFSIDLTFNERPAWAAAAEDLTLAYKPLRLGAEKVPGEQPILAGRTIMRPAVDLNLYRCKAVLDWIEIRLETSGRHQALNIHRKAQGILSAQGLAATLFVYGPRREARYIGSSFILRILQPQSHQLVPFLKAMVAEYAPDTQSVADLIVEGIELSVDFFVKPVNGRSQAASDLLRYRMVDALQRHLRPEPILTETDACRPRFFSENATSPTATFLVETKRGQGSRSPRRKPH